MQPRPVRSQIYLPVLRFGITDEDWGFVIVAGVLGYAIPMLLGLKAGGLPMEMVSWLLTMGISIAVLNLIRRKSRLSWLKHVLQAKLKGSISRRRLPHEACPPWLKTNQENQ